MNEMPAVRQDPVTGAVAVKLPENSPLGEWGYMSTNRGGGFLTAAEVEGWTPMVPS